MASSPDLERLRRFDTCTLADAIETFEIRLRNQGFTRRGPRCVNGSFAPVLGYAATARVKTSDTPMLGHAPLVRSDWWPTVEKLPQPRIAVIEDTDDPPGAGAVVGLAAVAVLRAMHCVAAVTNGAVRDVEAISRVQFPLFAGSLCPSHSYAHVLEFDHTVDVFGLVVAPGDLLMVDTHGVLSIPPDIVDQLPAAAEDMARRRREFVAFCESPQFSPERIAEEVQRLLL